MTSQAKQIAVGLLLGLLFLPGCAARWMNEYQVDRISNYRVDNLDGDGLWDTGDSNGNGKIDDDESIGTIVDIDQAIPTQALDRNNYKQTNGFSSSILTLSYSSLEDIGFGEYSGLTWLRDNQESRKTSLNGSNRSKAFHTFSNDLNENGGIFFTFLGSNGEILGTGLEFDELHLFNLVFSQMHVRSNNRTNGIQLNEGIRISAPVVEDDDVAKQAESKNYFEFCYGARYFRIQNKFSWDGQSELLGFMYSDTSVINDLAGPQLAVRWITSKHDWEFQTSALAMVGYNNFDSRQLSAMGIGLEQPQRNTDQHQDTVFTGLAELNASLARDLSENVSLQVGCNAFYLEQLRNAENSVVWQLPNFGISNNKGNDLLISSVYASIEFRR